MKYLSHFILASAALLYCNLAVAQQTVIQGGTWVAGHSLIYAPNSPTAPVVLDSGTAPAIISPGTAGQIPWYAVSGITLIGNPNLVYASGLVTIGQSGSVNGSLGLSGSVSGLVSIIPQAAAGTWNFNLPTGAGTANQPLLSQGGGSTAMSWGTLSGNTSEFATVSGSLTPTHCVVVDASGNLSDNGQGCGGSGTVNSGSAGQFTYYAGTGTTVSGSSVLSVSGGNISDTGTFTSAGLTSTGANTFSPANANDVLSPTGTGVVTISPATVGTLDNMTIGATTPRVSTFTSSTVNGNLSVGVAGVSIGQILVSGNSSGTITFKPQAAAGTYNWNYPITAGTNNQPLISGGGGGTAMSWGTRSGNTSEFATANGALTSGHCVNIDASGNFQDAGAACATGQGTVNAGTSGQITYYASSTNAVSGNANANISGGALTLGTLNSTQGSLVLDGSSSGAISVLPQAAAGTYNFNLPITAGTSGQPLLSAGGGSAPMTYGTLSGNTTKFGTATGSFTNGNCIAADASGNLIDNGSPCGTGGSGTVTAGVAGQMAYYASSTAAVAGNSFANISSGRLTLGVLNTSLGSLVLDGSTSGAVTLKPQAAAGTYELDLPTTAGSAGQVLTSQGGAGTAMTWTTPGITWGGAPQTVSFNATANTRYCIDTLTTGAVTMTLPASPADGDQIGFIDCKSNFATTNFTVARNGKNIMGSAANMTVNTSNAAATLIYSSTLSDWRMF